MFHDRLNLPQIIQPPAACGGFVGVEVSVGRIGDEGRAGLLDYRVEERPVIALHPPLVGGVGGLERRETFEIGDGED